MKILFQGDSVTDGGRDRCNTRDMGEGYPKYASVMIQDTYPNIEFDFINLGISGDRAEDLASRLDSDFIEIRPDIVSIMIGINDAMWKHLYGVEVTDADFERHYENVLKSIKFLTNAKILVIQPFELDPNIKAEAKADLASKQGIVKKLADEYADAYLPLADILADVEEEERSTYSDDGYHPNSDGACYIGEQYLNAIMPLIGELSEDD